MPHFLLFTDIPPLLRDITLKSLLLLAVAALASLLLRRSAAAARHAVWLTALTALLLLPVFCLLLPPWSAPILPTPKAAAVAAPSTVAPPVAAPITPPANPMPAAASPPMPLPAASMPSYAPAAPPFALPAAPPAPQSHRLTLAADLSLLWPLGFLLVIGRLLLGLVSASRLVRRCRLVTQTTLINAADAARHALGLTRPIVLRVGPVAVPMTCGLLRPVILLPADADTWPEGRLRAVLLHEGAHIRRGDWATGLLTHCVCAVYWFHPGVWLAAGRLRAEAETACDDLVLSCGLPASDYAAHLLAVVQGLSLRRSLPAGTVAMAHRPDVSTRLQTILDTDRSRRPLPRRALIFTGLLALTLLTPLAALRPVASAPTMLVQTKIAQHNNLGVIMSDPRRLASLMAGKSMWEKRLPDGTRLRLLFVAAQGGPPRYNIVSSWQPDGAPQGSATANIPSFDGQHSLQIVWGVTFASAQQQARASVMFGKAGMEAGEGGAVFPTHPGQPQWLNYAEWFPADQKRGAIKVEVATGQPTTLITAQARMGGVRRLATNETISVSPELHRAADVAHENGRLLPTTTVFVTLPARFVRNTSGYDFQPIGANGKPVRFVHGSWSFPQVTGKTARLLYTYRTSELAQVTAFRFLYRPSYTAVFQNVALRPVGGTAGGNSNSPNQIVRISAIFPLTHSPGAIVQGTGSGARMHILGSSQTFDFDCDTTTLKITSVKAANWQLHDNAWNSLTLIDEAHQPVIVLNRTPYPISLQSGTGQSAKTISLPAHALLIFNKARYPLTITGRSSPTVAYRIAPGQTNFPLTIIRSVPPEGSSMASGNETTDTNFDM